MDRLAVVCEDIARFSSRLKKVGVLSAYLRSLENDDDLARAVRFLCATPLEPDPNQDRKLSAGYATMREAVLAVTGWDLETLRLCYREVGDSGETIALLLHGHTRAEEMTLADAERLYRALNRVRHTADKIALLKDAFSTYRPPALKYFLKVMTGDLRIGLQEKMVEEAVAAATGATHAEVREANNRAGHLARVAVAARHGLVDTIAARLFHPMDFMLAKPLDSLEDLPDPEQWIVEDKYDGIRSQAHFENGRVVIYTRGLNEVTASFPEIVEALQFVGGSAVLDGELLAWRDGRALSFNVLEQRIARKKVTSEMLASVPVVFMGYDALYRDGELLLERPIEERRRVLEETLAGAGSRLLLSPQSWAASQAAIDRHFEQARARGNEGLVLKRRGSLYEAGRRSGAWYKVKRPYGTLDVVITAAEHGHGKRATVLSDYTFAVRAGDEFWNVGKAYSGLTDAEIRELTRRLRAATTDRYGRVLLVRPEIVLEVAFDGVQKSPRHKSGYALRFPRIVRWRQDKRPGEIDTLEQVEALYLGSLAR